MTKHPILFPLLLALVITLAYAFTLNAPFLFDDLQYLYENPSVHTLANFFAYWTHPEKTAFLAKNYVLRPLLFDLHALCWQLGNGATWPFHVVKIILHWAACLAIFSMWKKLWSLPGWLPTPHLTVRVPASLNTLTLGPTQAAAALSLLFAIHPACSETVSYVSATSSLLCATLYLWAFVFYLHQRTLPSLLFFALAFFVKEEAATLPAIIFLSELMLFKPNSSRWKNAFLKTIPYAALLAALLTWYISFQSAQGSYSNFGITPFQYFLTQTRAYFYYMGLWLWPWVMHGDYLGFGFSFSIFDSRVLAAITALALLTAGLVRFRKQFPAVVFGVLWFFITLTPHSSFVPIDEPIAERRMYLAGAGFLAAALTLFFYFLEKFSTKKTKDTWLPTVLIGTLLLLFVGTFVRARTWSNPELFWLDTLEKEIYSPRAFNNLAVVYMAQGRLPEAYDLLDACARIQPQAQNCLVNRAVVLDAMGRYDEAEKSFLDAHKGYPKDPFLNLNLAKLALRKNKNSDIALDYLKTADQESTFKNIPAKLLMAKIYIAKNNKTQAEKTLNDVLALEPSHKEAAQLLVSLKALP